MKNFVAFPIAALAMGLSVAFPVAAVLVGMISVGSLAASAAWTTLMHRRMPHDSRLTTHEKGA